MKSFYSQWFTAQIHTIARKKPICSQGPFLDLPFYVQGPKNSSHPLLLSQSISSVINQQ